MSGHPPSAAAATVRPTTPEGGEGAAAAEDGSSSVADALRWPRKATLRAALQALTLSSRGPCDAPPSRRTTLLAEEPARPSDVSPSYESKYWTGRSRRPPRRQSGGKRQGRGARITSDSGFPPLRPSSTAFAPGRRRARGGAGEGRQFNARRWFACPTGTAASQGFRTASRMASDVSHRRAMRS